MNYEEILNEQQLLGVRTTEGPVLILAGAGSGKTRVLVHRICYLIEECDVNPWNIMAITFTNKAAGEMRSRIENMSEVESDGVWVSTFHSACVRILRRFGDHIGYDNHFTIYDTEDSKAAMREVLKGLNVDQKKYREKYFLNIISAAKNELVDEEAFPGWTASGGKSDDDKMCAKAYRAYQARLKESDAMDFDDLILKTVELLRKDEEALAYYQRKLQYVMVDEYQDTNTAQFELVKLLASGSGNLCVVGDDDQSIYRFRGANIYNILNFEQNFPNTKVIKLEQNYRSTQKILAVANAMIKLNQGRKDKTLWTENDEGKQVRFKQIESAYGEAEFVATDVERKHQILNEPYSHFAVLYRTNAQSRILEEKFLMENVPYRIVGGLNFYQRREIKDILSYLRVIGNHKDDISIRRILNVPKRGIGPTTEAKISQYAQDNGISYYEALKWGGGAGVFGRSSAKIADFITMMETFKEEAKTIPVKELLEHVVEQTGYREALEAEKSDNSRARIENLNEFLSKAAEFDQVHEPGHLLEFLEEVALIADIDRTSPDEDVVLLMTMHSAKGLEFPHVYVTGFEDGLFPSYPSITAETDEELEEERRLCYVAMTRAMKTLTLTRSRIRMVNGEQRRTRLSRFIKEIPDELLDGSLEEERKKRQEEQQQQPQDAAAGRKKKKFYRPGETAAASYQKKLQNMNAGTKIEKQELSYGVGDRVEHAKYGQGVVSAITDGGRDYEVSVEFDDAGKKRMFASFAKLEKI